MADNDPASHRIPLDKAAAMTARYRKSVPEGSTLAGMFPAGVFRALLAQPGCTGIRIYLARKDDAAVAGDGAVDFILVGCNAKGNDMCQFDIMDVPLMCPPACAVDSPLSTDLADS